MTTKGLFRVYLRRAWRSPVVIAGLLFLLVTGGASLAIGYRFLTAQQAAISEAQRYQQAHIEKHAGYFNSEMGLLLYYLRFTLVNPPDPLAGISIGQKDVNPAIQRVTIRNLEAQKYDTDLHNPVNQLFGNLDLAFVLICLFPLVIIAISYNALSEEKEGGTWSLLRLHSAAPRRLIVFKLLVRYVLMSGLALLLLGVAVPLYRVPVGGPLLLLTTMVLLYLLFWFACCYWVISWHRASAFNAVALLVIWVSLNLLAPAAVNTLVSQLYPVPEALETAVKQRQGYHEKWDMDRAHTMKKFYAHYPQYSALGVPAESFSWLWYYAMQQMGDDEASRESQRLREKLYQREGFSQRISLLLPVLHVQQGMTTLARSGLSDHLAFLDSTTRFHEKLRLGFYPSIFSNKPVASVNWKAFRIETFRSQVTYNGFLLLAPLLFFTALLYALGSVRLRRADR